MVRKYWPAKRRKGDIACVLSSFKLQCQKKNHCPNDRIELRYAAGAAAGRDLSETLGLCWARKIWLVRGVQSKSTQKLHEICCVILKMIYLIGIQPPPLGKTLKHFISLLNSTAFGSVGWQQQMRDFFYPIPVGEPASRPFLSTWGIK